MPDKMVAPGGFSDGEGLTRREYFAIMSMQGMIAAGAEIATTKTAHAHRNQKLAKRAVEVADALIEELDR